MLLKILILLIGSAGLCQQAYCSGPEPADNGATVVICAPDTGMGGLCRGQSCCALPEESEVTGLTPSETPANPVPGTVQRNRNSNCCSSLEMWKQFFSTLFKETTP